MYTFQEGGGGCVMLCVGGGVMLCGGGGGLCNVEKFNRESLTVETVVLASLSILLTLLNRVKLL